MSTPANLDFPIPEISFLEFDYVFIKLEAVRTSFIDYDTINWFFTSYYKIKFILYEIIL